ncbi:MAG: hypothetical protein GF421_12090 [Candidatus Aminicenantes bacterium]|nr:hypothetical protein [Candidatus Aminicenantes bacterium]
MAGFEGVQWASKQMRYLLDEKQFEILEEEAKVFAVSRSIHYGQFLAFEGIRFFCRKNKKGRLEIIFLNWNDNLIRFQKGISFNLGKKQQKMVPKVEELENIFIHHYFKHPVMKQFLEKMAEKQAQGYLRPFTVDEEQSIGVTFPGKPSIRAVTCSYKKYLGEPFKGVVVPQLVRAVGINQTGCLKLGINYLISVKAIDAAKKIDPEAASALFLDDRPDKELGKRNVTEWDSSCCLFALRDNTVIKIPENELILPSVTIQGITRILKKMGAEVKETHISYQDLIDWVQSKKLVAICSVGTAGILNRCSQLILVDNKKQKLAVHQPDQNHRLYKMLSEARTYYWDIYKQKAAIPEGIRLNKYVL